MTENIEQIALRVAEEVGIKAAFVCGRPDECPDDDDCCHFNTPNGRWLKPGKLEDLARRLAYYLTKGQEPDCWAVLTPNGSRLVSTQEAKGLLKAYPLYAAPIPAICPSCMQAADDPPSAESIHYGLKFCCGKYERLLQENASLRNVVQRGMIANCKEVFDGWNYHFPDDQMQPYKQITKKHYHDPWPIIIVGAVWVLIVGICIITVAKHMYPLY